VEEGFGDMLTPAKRKKKRGGRGRGGSQKTKERARGPREGQMIHRKGLKVDNQILTKIREIKDNSSS
jgi:hypothetical protein